MGIWNLRAIKGFMAGAEGFEPQHPVLEFDSFYYVPSPLGTKRAIDSAATCVCQYRCSAVLEIPHTVAISRNGRPVPRAASGVTCMTRADRAASTPLISLSRYRHNLKPVGLYLGYRPVVACGPQAAGIHSAIRVHSASISLYWFSIERLMKSLATVIGPPWAAASADRTSNFVFTAVFAFNTISCSS